MDTREGDEFNTGKVVGEWGQEELEVTSQYNNHNFHSSTRVRNDFLVAQVEIIN